MSRHARARARCAGIGSLIVLAALAGSCAYYNTYYLAKKYYFKATGGLPYQIEKPVPANAGDYQKSIEYAKKVIADYAKSKWVDDAYLMWAQALLGKGDPLQTVNMLQEFSVRFPQSSLKANATFYLGVAYRQARKYRESLVALDEYIAKEPKGDLAAYAHLERARALTSLERSSEAAAAASHVIEEFPASDLVVQARATRGEALLTGGQFTAARADFAALGVRSRDDDERFRYLLREADCLEAARDYQAELSLLGNALSHEPKPIPTVSGAAPTGPAAERYGQLMLRIGTVHLLSERKDLALNSYETVIKDYPKTGLAAEAQYRIGYAYETAFDDFDRARQEYVKVRDQSMGSAFFAQANTRLASLERLARYRAPGADSTGRRVEAGFLLAEQYLFQLEKPDRALEAYQQIEHDFPNSPSAAKAINAQAWVLRRKLDRPGAADSLLWTVVREYPATEAQLAARDYLEAQGQQVPTELIKLPENFALADTAMNLSHPPDGSLPLGTVTPEGGALVDSSGQALMPTQQTEPMLIPGPSASGLPPPPLIAPIPVVAGAPAGAPVVPGANPAPPRTGASPASRHDDPPRPPADTTATAPPDTSGKRP